jgi:diadenosine tetraphosphatase ApaH/serine/threonine PP2A family protein phosphatase
MFLNTDPVEHCLQPVLELAPDRRVIVNVGSVGQPRDLDPRACYALWDTDEQEIRLRRVDYDQDGASRKIAAAGLPITNARRIVLGR